MKAYLKSGPAHGQVVPHPRVSLYRHIIPKPLDMLTVHDLYQQSFDPTVAKPNYVVAHYKFSGMAFTSLDGDVQYMLYEFDGMES